MTFQNGNCFQDIDDRKVGYLCNLPSLLGGFYHSEVIFKVKGRCCLSENFKSFANIGEEAGIIDIPMRQICAYWEECYKMMQRTYGEVLSTINKLNISVSDCSEVGATDFVPNRRVERTSLQRRLCIPNSTFDRDVENADESRRGLSLSILYSSTDMGST